MLVVLDTLVPQCRRQLLTSLLTRTFHSSIPRRVNSINNTTPAAAKPKRPIDKWDYSKQMQAKEDSKEEGEEKYAFVTATELSTHKEPPTGVRMLVRDFIEDSLYNPSYGYFSKQATIFNSSSSSRVRQKDADREREGFDFNSIRDGEEFQSVVAEAYMSSGPDPLRGPGKQIWHTPTELFRPWYGQAIARCLVSEYLLKYFPYEDFVIYEVGAGNGTLALDILSYIQQYYPEVYDRTRYNIVEISESLAREQRRRLQVRHPCAIRVHKKSIFEWQTREPAPCFFVMMEVVDNFAHDVIRHDVRTLQPYQGVVEISSQGDFSTIYTPIMDPLIKSFFSLRQKLSHTTQSIPRLLRLIPPFLRSTYTTLPLTPNLTTPEYIPTRLLSLMHILHKFFPRHRLLLSDFSSLPDAIPGISAPVVQTRLRDQMIPCSTYLVKQGFFDIFFPTNFERLQDMYEYILSEPAKYFDSSSYPIYPDRPNPLAPWSYTPSPGTNLDSQFFLPNQNSSTRRRPLTGVSSSSGLPVGERKSSVFTHAEFLETYADTGRTRLMNGENPMVEYYKNVKVLF